MTDNRWKYTLKILAHIVVLGIAAITTILCFFSFSSSYSEYNLIWFLPLIFCFVYILVYLHLLRSKNIFITKLFFGVFSFVRCVLIPLFIALAGPSYAGVRYITLPVSSIRFATLITVYEVLVASLFIYLLSKNNKNKIIDNTKNMRFMGNKKIYIIYLIFSVFLYLIFGRKTNLLSLFAFSLSGDKFSNIESAGLLFVRQVVVCAIIVAFIWSISYCKKNFEQTRKTKYVNLAILSALFNVSVIVGDRRSIQVYTALISIWILTKIFDEHKKRIIISICSVAFLVIFLMTMYRLGAFKYGSYLAAYRESNLNITWLTNTLQMYFGGPDSVATAIVYGQNSNLGLLNIVFDFVRSCFGFNFVLKDLMYTTTQSFNYYLYNGSQLTGQLIPSGSYGYIYFGLIGIPSIVCINIWISSVLEKLLYKTKSYEMAYVYGYSLIRISVAIYSNTPTVITFITTMIGTMGLVYLAARIFVRKYYKKTILLENNMIV